MQNVAHLAGSFLWPEGGSSNLPTGCPLSVINLYLILARLRRRIPWVPESGT